MVSQAIEEEVVTDPEAEVQTEAPAEVVFEQPEEAPAEPAEQPAAEDDRIAALEARLAELQRKDEERARQAERDRRNRQREGSIRAQEQQRQQAEDAEATDLLRAQLISMGMVETDPQMVKPILDRYAAKKESFVTTRTLDDVASAFSAAAAEVLDVDYDGELSPKAQAYSQNFLPFVKDMYERAKADAMKDEDLVSRKDLPKLVKAEIERQNAEARKGRAPLRTAEGQSVTTNDTDDDRLTRINSGQATEADREWWQSRYGLANRR